jgi:hypothetical protein
MGQSHFPDLFAQHLESDNGISRAGINRSNRDILSALVGALDTQISTEVASMRCKTPARKLQKEILMVVPVPWTNIIKRLALQVRFSLA